MLFFRSVLAAARLTSAFASVAAFPWRLCLQRTPQETLYKIKTQEVSYPSELSEGATAFIKAALVRDPEGRASLADLLQHPWLLKHLRSSAGPPHMRGRTQTQVGAGAPTCMHRPGIVRFSHGRTLALSSSQQTAASRLSGQPVMSACVVHRLRSCSP